jgi:hypothetical protein
LNLSVPNLTTLVLTNNNITELGDLEPLRSVKGLKYLSLLGNPVREKKWYREWLTWRLPGLRVLDFQRILDKVRPLPRLPEDAQIQPVVGETSSEGLVLDCRWAHELPRHNIINDCVDRRGKERYDGGRASPCSCTREGWPASDEGRSQQGQGGHRQGNFCRGNPTFGEKLKGGVSAQHGECGGIVVVFLTRSQRSHDYVRRVLSPLPSGVLR